MDGDVGVCAVALDINADIAEEKEAAEVAFRFGNFESVERFAGLEEEFALDDFCSGTSVAFYGDGSDEKRGSMGKREKQAEVDKKRRARSVCVDVLRFALCFI